MNEIETHKTYSNRALWIRLGILCLFWIWMCWPEMRRFASAAINGSEMAHAVAFPLAGWVLFCRRKKELISKSRSDSMVSILLLLLSIMLYAALQWPFSFAYAEDLIVLFILLSVIAIAAGFRFMMGIFPIILLAFLCIPMGSRMYATLIIYPETYTLIAVNKVLSLFPGLKVLLEGVDILFEYAGRSGAIALGESNRGARLFLAYAFIGTFVTFSEVRSWSRLLFVAICTCPILLFCNFLRLLFWAVVVIFLPFGTLSGWPRILSALISLLMAYLLYRFVCSPRLSLFVSEESKKDHSTCGSLRQDTSKVDGSYFPVPFLLGVIILVLSTLFLRPSLAHLEEYYRKKPIAIRQKLGLFPVSELPSFKEGWHISSHEAPVEDMGTDEYVHLLMLRKEKNLFPEHMEFFVTYYSDPEDQVPHTPDVCSRQAGDVVLQMKPVSLSCRVGQKEYTPQGWCLLLEQTEGVLVDVFVFYVDGHFRRDRQAVRWDIFKPGNRHVFFSKIEVAVKISRLEDTEEALQWCKRLFAEAAPILIEKHFPSEQQVRSR